MYITHSGVGIQYQVPLSKWCIVLWCPRLPRHERARAGRRNWSIEVAKFVNFVFDGLMVLATASLTTSEFSQVVKYLSDGCLIFRHAEVRYFQLGSARTRLQCLHPELPNCNHVGVASESMFCDAFSFLMKRHEKTLNKKSYRIQIDLQTTYRAECRWHRPSNDTRKTVDTRGADADVASDAADALWNLLHMGESSVAWAALPPEPVAAALLGAMRRHPRDGDVQVCGCFALYYLCKRFPAVLGALQPDPSVLTTVRAAAAVDPQLEQHDFYKELCPWLQPFLVCGRWSGVGGGRANQKVARLSSLHELFYCCLHSAPPVMEVLEWNMCEQVPIGLPWFAHVWLQTQDLIPQWTGCGCATLRSWIQDSQTGPARIRLRTHGPSKFHICVDLNMT